jgi:glutathione-regulated potassium-efflux system ancillary protein KefC
VLDHDPDSIETLRRFGFRVFYGDAARLDLLESAGAAHAKLLVVAIDDPKTSVELCDLVRDRFPHLKLLVRARNVTHYLELKQRGIDQVERETFESALRAGRRALEILDHEPYEARQLAEAFRRHNVSSLDGLLPHLEDASRRVNLVKAARDQLEAQFRRDRERREETGSDWHG